LNIPAKGNAYQDYMPLTEDMIMRDNIALDFPQKDEDNLMKDPPQITKRKPSVYEIENVPLQELRKVPFIDDNAFDMLPVRDHVFA
jgi:hypothetical protein